MSWISRITARMGAKICASGKHVVQCAKFTLANPKRLFIAISTIIGMPGALYGLGLAVLPLSYLTGVVICAAAAPLLVGIIWLFVRRPALRWILTLCAIAASAVALRVIYVPVNVTVSMQSGRGDYGLNSDVYGTTWQPDYAELALYIANTGTYDMTDVDVYVTTDELIVGAGVVPGIDGCTSEAVMPNMLAASKFTSKDAQGRILETPFNQKSNPLASSLYRIRCPRLSANRLLEIKLPILARQFPIGVPKQPPKWAVAWISLSAGLRHVEWRVQQCFGDPCSKLPAEKTQVRLDFGPSKFMNSSGAAPTSSVIIQLNKDYVERALKSGP